MVTSHFDVEREIVRRFLSLLGLNAPELSDPNAGRSVDSGVDVMLKRDGERIGYQVTEYHGGEAPGARGGSALRREESQRARNPHTYAMYGVADPLQGLVARISEKVRQSAKYDFKEFDRVNLILATNVPTWGASASTFLLEAFLSLEALERITAPLLDSSRYGSAYIFVMQSASGGSAVFARDRDAGWRRLA